MVNERVHVEECFPIEKKKLNFFGDVIDCECDGPCEKLAIANVFFTVKSGKKRARLGWARGGWVDGLQNSDLENCFFGDLWKPACAHRLPKCTLSGGSSLDRIN